MWEEEIIVPPLARDQDDDVRVPRVVCHEHGGVDDPHAEGAAQVGEGRGHDAGGGGGGGRGEDCDAVVGGQAAEAVAEEEACLGVV